MQLGWVDVANPKRIYLLPRQKGEARTGYTLRFFNEIRGLGRCFIVTKRGLSVKWRASRGS